MRKRKIIITCSLPYANGDLHLGHLVEYIQADIWTRFQKLQHNECYFICGSDCHGTPIMLKAQQENVNAEKLVFAIKQRHQQDMQDFDILFDNFHHSHSQENQSWVEKFYAQACKNGDIKQKNIEQAFDATKNMFLPDRFVKGICPKCDATEQYGDNCEQCGAVYDIKELKESYSTLSQTKPIYKESQHYFFTLANYQQILQQWINGNLQIAVQHKLQEWLKDKLHDWNISRDAPYFGFKIPNTDNKYFYVWFDAPFGYLASLEDYLKDKDFNVTDLWNAQDTEIYHFIGKDVMYFHTLFWPALLHSSNFKMPTAVFVHGFLTINSLKMSKSRGTFITARKYLQHLDISYLRYYYACKLNNSINDLDFNTQDFMDRVNSDLIGKLINIPSRLANFLKKYFANILSKEIDNLELWQQVINAKTELTNCYEKREYAAAIRKIMHLADLANQYISQNKPWQLIKDQQFTKAHFVCTMGINLFKQLIVYLKPIIPTIAAKVENFLNVAVFDWNSQDFLADHKINDYKVMLTRITEKEIMHLTTENVTTDTNINNTEKTKETTNIKTQINIDDFAKLDLRIATIIKAEIVAEADKLLKIIVDIGNETKQVFAGIKKYYQPENLINKQVLFLANLKPRKMRFGISEGMILAANNDKLGAVILHPDQEISCGDIVK